MVPDEERVFRLSVAMIVLTGLAVLVRFLTRAGSKMSLAAEEWWVFSSLTFYYVYMGLQIWIVTNGAFGRPVTPMSLPSLEYSIKVIYVATPMSISTTATAKISLLCLYHRIFATQSFRRKNLIVGLAVSGYWIAAVFGSIFQCAPVSGVWNKTAPSKCIDFAAFFLGLELVNCLLDVAMIILPLGVIQDLHMPLKKRIQLGIIFMLGGLVFFAGIIRMAVIYRGGSETISFFPNLIWSTIENGLAIICACLPTYRPLLSKSLSILSNVNSWYASLLGSAQKGRTTRPTKDTPSQSAHSTESQQRKQYDRIEDGTLENSHLTSAIGGLSKTDGFVPGRDYPLNTINVQSTTEVV